MVRLKAYHLKKVSKDYGADKRGVSPYLSIVTLNINRLNSSIERQRMPEWIKNSRSNNMTVSPQQTASLQDSLYLYGHTKTRSRGMEKEMSANVNQKKAGIAILTLDK